MNAGAAVVTSNVRDFTLARTELGLQVLTPGEFLWHLTEHRPAGSDQNQE